MRAPSRPAGHCPWRATRERGFTLAELLISVLVLSIGLLALTGASAVIARQVNGGARMSLAASVAESRFERLRAQDCATAADGASASRGIAETWSVTRMPGGVRITDTVALDLHRGRRVYVFEALVSCATSDP